MAQAIINLNNIKHNYLYAKSLTNNKVLAVVKTNAYGLGVGKIAKYLDDFVDGFCVAIMDEALELRDLNINKQILVMMGCFNDKELNLAVKNNLSVAITSKQQLELMLNFDKKINIFLKFDSGMSRLGLSFADIMKFYPLLKSKKNINNITLMSHFSCSDEVNKINDLQIDRFNKLKDKLNIKSTSFSNSAAIFNKLYQQTYARLGIGLYGLHLGCLQKNTQLKSVVSLYGNIIDIKTIKKGRAVGYGGNFLCTKDTKIAVVHLGYGDGYPRNVKNNGRVFIAGKYCPIIGAISMDMLTIDIDKLDALDVKIGDKAEMFGEHITIEELAKSTQMIAYEIFCNLSTRVTRIYQK